MHRRSNADKSLGQDTRLGSVFSRRTSWDRRPTALAHELAERRRADLSVLDLTESNPTSAGFEAPRDVLELLADPEGRRYEPTAHGIEPAREAVARVFAEQGWPLPADQVTLTASTSEAYSFLLKLLCEPDDSVVAATPSYPLLDYLADLEGVECRRFALNAENAWSVDPEAVLAAAGERTRAVVVVHPNNPTGSALTSLESDRLEEVCRRRGLALVSDEVFADFRLEAPRAVPQTLGGDRECLTFCLGGLSKVCALPQLKLAWIAVGGPEALLREAIGRLEIIADSFLSVSTPVQLAAAEILARRSELREPLVARLRSNLEALDGLLAAHPTVTRERVDGGWNAVLRFPRTEDDEVRALRWLDERGIFVHPGELFGFPDPGRYVISLLTPPAAFAEGVAGILATP